MEDKRLNEVIRVKKQPKSFVVLDKGFLEDERLSFKAKGILAYLLSKPDDWKVIVGNLVKQSKDGKAAIYAGLKELKDCGYYTKVPVRNEEGTRIIRWESTVYEVPNMTQDIKEVQEQQLETNPQEVLQESIKTEEEKEVSLLSDFQEVEKQEKENQFIENWERNNNYSTNIKNTKNDNKIKSDSMEQKDDIGQQEIETVATILKKNVSYEDLKITHAEDIDLIDDFISVGVDALISKGKSVRIKGEEKPRELVKSNLMKLNYSSFVYMLENFKDYGKRIKKMQPYMLSMLYSSPMECNAHYKNWVRADLGY